MDILKIYAMDVWNIPSSVSGYRAFPWQKKKKNHKITRLTMNLMTWAVAAFAVQMKKTREESWSCVVTSLRPTRTRRHAHTSLYGLQVCGLHSAAPEALWSLQQTPHSATTAHRKWPFNVAGATAETPSIPLKVAFLLAREGLCKTRLIKRTRVFWDDSMLLLA